MRQMRAYEAERKRAEDIAREKRDKFVSEMEKAAENYVESLGGM